MKRICGRALIFIDDSIILLYRRRLENNKILEYYAIPGGTLEENETIEDCTIREINEELNLNIELKDKISIIEDYRSISHIFNCDIINGTPLLGGEELEHNNENNYYEIRYVKLSEIDKINIFEENKELIKKAYVSRGGII